MFLFYYYQPSCRDLKNALCANVNKHENNESVPTIADMLLTSKYDNLMYHNFGWQLITSNASVIVLKHNKKNIFF